MVFLSPHFPYSTLFIAIHGLKYWWNKTELWNLTWPSQLVLIILCLISPLKKLAHGKVEPYLILGSWFCNRYTERSDCFCRGGGKLSIIFRYSFIHSCNKLLWSYLIHAKLYSKYWGYGIEQSTSVFLNELIIFLLGEVKSELINRSIYNM